MNKTIKVSLNKKDLRSIIKKDNLIRLMISPDYNWIINKRLPYDYYEYINGNYKNNY